MKNAILFLLLAGSITANSQSETKPSLKDLLYSGKLKLDSTAVIKKGDDLSSKIDTSTKKAEPALSKAVPATGDLGKPPVPQLNTVADGGNITDSAAPAADAVKAPVTPAKSNTKIWKEYTDSLTTTLKTELLTSKKIKKETYFLTVDYEIGADGIVSILNVVSTPENAFLQDEVKKRMEFTIPQLVPVLDSSGKPRKVKRKYNFNLTKE
ncbi:MAG: hypothetical protein JWR72_3963 [Flavisolibacter sp.]|nr:hypothetical protein [Flavisolibacter sp.]